MRISVEEIWWDDPRRAALINRIGNIADGLAIHAWMTAKKYWLDGERFVPKEIFELIPHSEILIECNLAEKAFDENQIYVKGTHEFFGGSNGQN